jgi:hypothetical protein
MCEITGSEYPNEIVAIGGHSDSHDCGKSFLLVESFFQFFFFLFCVCSLALTFLSFVGQGAHDDAQGLISTNDFVVLVFRSSLFFVVGCILAWEIIRLLKLAGIRPKRTIRAGEKIFSFVLIFSH